MVSDRVRHVLLGSPPRRVLRGIGLAITLTVSSATIFIALFRLSMALDFVGPTALAGGPGQITGWSPDWWSQLWVGALVALVVISFALAVRDASRKGGFVGSIALVISVPAGTVVYQQVLANYTRYFNIPFDTPAFPHPFGYFIHPEALFTTWTSLYAIDLVVMLGLAAAVFLEGRHVSDHEPQDRWTVIAVSALFFGPGFVGYFQPSPATFWYPHHLVYILDTPSFFLYHVGIGIGLAALGWVAINGFHIARERDLLSRSGG